jgi:hypothetical protein
VPHIPYHFDHMGQASREDKEVLELEITPNNLDSHSVCVTQQQNDFEVQPFCGAGSPNSGSSAP